MKISVVIIGRNSSELLKSNYLNKNNLVFADEVLYVDSDSADNTIDLVRQIGWEVIELSKEGVLSAAAGRYAGANHVNGDYILFLDSDMTVDMTRDQIKGLINKYIVTNDNVMGVSGMTLNIFQNGNQSMVVKRRKEGEITDTFGGFCLLDRKELLKVGNWNPNVIANEENELYARIKKNKKEVILSRDFVCNHYTENPDKGHVILLNAYFPTNPKASRVYGACGMGLKASLEAKSIFEYLYYFNSEVVLFTLFFSSFLILSFYIGWVNLLIYTLCSMSFLIFWTVRKRKLSFVLLLPSYMIQMIYGFFKYKNKKIILK